MVDVTYYMVNTITCICPSYYDMVDVTYYMVNTITERFIILEDGYF